MAEGGRITRTVEGNLTLARKIEAKIKSDVAQEKHLGTGGFYFGENENQVPL